MEAASSSLRRGLFIFHAAAAATRAREQPPSVYNHGYAASCEQAMRYFKARYVGPPTN